MLRVIGFEVLFCIKAGNVSGRTENTRDLFVLMIEALDLDFG